MCRKICERESMQRSFAYRKIEFFIQCIFSSISRIPRRIQQRPQMNSADNAKIRRSTETEKMSDGGYAELFVLSIQTVRYTPLYPSDIGTRIYCNQTPQAPVTHLQASLRWPLLVQATAMLGPQLVLASFRLTKSKSQLPDMVGRSGEAFLQSLKPARLHYFGQGVLVLIGSDASKPNCRHLREFIRRITDICKISKGKT